MKQVKLDDVREETPQMESAESTSEMKRLGVGTLLSETFGTFFRNWVPFTAIALLVYLPVYIGILALFGIDLANFQFDPNNVQSFASFLAGGMIFSILANAVMTAAISYGAIEDLAGRKASFGEMLTVGLRNFLPVIMAMIVAMVLILLGAVLLVIPGIIVMLMLSVTTQVIVAERMGPIDALKRSAALTDGYKWTILGGLILVSIITEFALAIVNIPVSLIAVNASPSDTVFSVSILISGILESVSYAVLATYSASLYTCLRQVKEGASTEEIAAVFS